MSDRQSASQTMGESGINYICMTVDGLSQPQGAGCDVTKTCTSFKQYSLPTFPAITLAWAAYMEPCHHMYECYVFQACSMKLGFEGGRI